MVNTNNSPVGTSEYSMLFAGEEIDTITKCVNPLPYLNPQIVRQGPIITDTLNWTAISGTFTAAGHEKYMVLGNFKADANTNTVIINPTFLPTLSNDIYIDDVSLVEMELPAFAGRDTSIIPGDSVFIGRESDVGIDYACQWYKLPNTSAPFDTVAGLWVKPTETTSYLVRQQLWCSGVKWDTVTVFISGVGLAEWSQPLQVRIYPNPARDQIVIRTSEMTEDLAVSIYDVSGRLISTSQVKTERHLGSMRLALKAGLYFMSISGTSDETTTKKLIIAN